MTMTAHEIQSSDGVTYLTEPQSGAVHEAVYLEVRSAESRLLSDDVVRNLPDTSPNTPHHSEWQARKKSYHRLRKVLVRKQPATLLDIGCGNGWLLHALSRDLPHCRLHGADLNRVELQQASRLFTRDRMRWYYVDLLKESFSPVLKYDVIIFNASIQYFAELSQIMDKCKVLLTSKGSILINDSPFYLSKEEANAAQLRTERYYQDLGYPDMAQHYHHHTIDDAQAQGLKLYRPWHARLAGYTFPLYMYTRP